MRKLAVIALALSLAARSLFGAPIENPLENTIIEETKKDYDITGSFDKGSLILDAVLPINKNWKIFYNSDLENTGKYPIINKLEAAVGNRNFFIGASFGNLSTDTILENSNAVKAQVGIRPFDWFNASVTGAKISIPNFQTTSYSISPYQQTYKFPIDLYAIGWNANLGGEIKIGEVKLFPWISTIGSKYFASPTQNEDFHLINDNNPDGYDSTTISYPFDHLNVKAGLDVKLKLIDFRYQGEYEGQFYQQPSFNFTNKAGIRLHDEKEKLSMSYDVSLITKPENPDIISPTRNELGFDIGLFSLFSNGIFLKGQFSALVDFLTPTKFNIVAAIGKRIGEGNFELTYNLMNNSLGLQYSTSLDRTADKESQLRKNFQEINPPNSPDLSSNFGATDITSLHARFGNTLEDAVAYVKANGEQGLSDLIASITYQDHPRTFSARYEYEKSGYGACRDTNGNLIPYLEQAALGNECFAISLRGAYTGHVLAIKGKNGKYNLRNYQNYYVLNADSPEDATKMVYPGAYIFGNGDVTLPIQETRAFVEGQIVDWRKF